VAILALVPYEDFTRRFERGVEGIEHAGSRFDW
jgi:hypothetical protein